MLGARKDEGYGLRVWGFRKSEQIWALWFRLSQQKAFVEVIGFAPVLSMLSAVSAHQANSERKIIGYRAYCLWPGVSGSLLDTSVRFVTIKLIANKTQQGLTKKYHV